ncbi:MAG: oligosaccharide repeat unit polymerase [Elusimicrobia bacterium]|nr:oligosaccharide repeat unit polymerase [Elusimicrobiota bacterium]
MVGALCSFPGFMALRSRRFDPMEPIWLYVLLFLLEYFIKPLLTLKDPARFGFPMIPIDYDSAPVERSLLVAAAGLCAFYAGYYFISNSRRIPVVSLPDQWVPSREIVLFLVAFSAYACAVYFFFSRAGFSVSFIYLNRAAVGGMSGELSFLVHVFAWLSVVIPFRHVIRRRTALSAVAFVLFLSAIMVGLSIFGSRWTLLFIPVSLLVITHYAVKPLSIKSIGAAFLAIFILSAVFGAFRGNMDIDRISPDRVMDDVADEMMAYADWDISLAIVDFYPNNQRHYFGRLAMESFYWLIPRSIWSSKPIQYGPSRIQDDIVPDLRVFNAGGGYSGTAISQSTIGEGYADFGAFGAILYMAIFGAAWGWVFKLVRENVSSFPMAAVYSLLYISIPLYIRGFSSPLILMGLWGGLVMVIFYFLSERRKNSSRRLTSASHAPIPCT